MEIGTKTGSGVLCEPVEHLLDYFLMDLSQIWPMIGLKFGVGGILSFDFSYAEQSSAGGRRSTGVWRWWADVRSTACAHCGPNEKVAACCGRERKQAGSD